MVGSKYEQIIIDSNFFDLEFYNKNYNFDFDLATAVEHYVQTGESEYKLPSENFDPKAYILFNPDITGKVENLFCHYIEYGLNEGRYSNHHDISLDGHYLAKSGFFDEKYYFTNYGNDNTINLPPSAQYLAKWRVGHKANPHFDDLFYYHFYPDVKNFGACPALHFVKKGVYESRVKNESEYLYHAQIMRNFINQKYYLDQFKEINEGDDLIKHYLSIGKFNNAKLNNFFSADYYLRKYSDIRSSNIDPTIHFINHGRSENRTGIPDYNSIIERGELQYDYRKQTLIIANHEASRTGAPLVGLNIARELKAKYNIITYIGPVRSLGDDFKNSCSVLVKGPLSDLDAEYVLKYIKDIYNPIAIIMNSVETSFLSKAALNANIPSVALIHEFSEYTMPFGKVFNIVKTADRVVAPAEIIFDSIQKEVQAISSAKSSNIMVQPQGKLPFLPRDRELNDLSYDDIDKILEDKCGGRNKFVLGAGFATIRKGIDLFVQTAYELNKIRDDIAFIWCGAGFNPRKDPHYSIWVYEMIERMGLQSVVQFIPEQSNLDIILEKSSLFYLSSRLDPFPNVIIDALEADKPIVCFDRGTGCAEIFKHHSLNGFTVPYCDVVEAAKAISGIFNKKTESGINKSFVKNHLDFQHYIEKIENEILQATSFRETMMSNVNYVKENKLLDLDFFSGGPAGLSNVEDSIKEYVSGSLKGITNINPRRGFSENIFMNKNEMVEGKCGLITAYEKANCNLDLTKTHDNYEIFSSSSVSNKNLRVGIHIHLHYPDLAANIMSRISKIENQVDLYITTNSDRSLTKIKYECENVKNSNLNIEYYNVINRGRDIGPFLSTLSDDFLNKNYDIVGHFHGKKSLDSDPHMGSVWRDFIFDCLIGDGDSTMNNIFSLLSHDKSLGLIFAEDRYNVGWSDNFDHAQKLASELPINITLPKRPFFPMGTMFWAKPKIFDVIWKMKYKLESFPSEPLPYDGTILHAIERMLPSICEAEGFRWATVHKRGVMR